MNSEKNNDLKPTAKLVLMGLVAAMYVALTSSFGFGIVQFRMSEMFNHLAAFNKRYIVAVTLGVVIANSFQSPYGMIDVVVGSLQTLVMTSLAYFCTRKVKNTITKLTITTVISTLMMWLIAVEIMYMTKAPIAFWPTYGSLMVGELASMVLGGIIIYFISKRIDLTR
ncbi:QueT transporter family protein [Periweissella beninensis]|uniref:QueT transporter family protein n=1 Tax=Periweissella beninensis TaxID=504936 RepID=UPI0021A80988|nr:QueT transporter family protein [Periweissella beninensis]MCT4396602.1 QueT transporter family protein [Periweissella beninensis]